MKTTSYRSWRSTRQTALKCQTICSESAATRARTCQNILNSSRRLLVGAGIAFMRIQRGTPARLRARRDSLSIATGCSQIGGPQGETPQVGDAILEQDQATIGHRQT